MSVFEYRQRIFKPTNNPLTIMAIWDPCQISACERRQRAVKFKEEVEVCCLVSELKRILIIWFPFLHLFFTQITHKCARMHKASQLNAAKVWDFKQMCSQFKQKGKQYKRIRLAVFLFIKQVWLSVFTLCCIFSSWLSHAGTYIIWVWVYTSIG